jgi:hypothetical protein
MGKHHNPEKAQAGYKYCGYCGTTKSPESQTPFKGSWADQFGKKSNN